MAAGDRTARLAANVRTHLDESSAAFWTASEVYQALTNAQNEVIRYLWVKFLKTEEQSETLGTAVPAPSTINVTSGVATLPTDFLFTLSVRYKADQTNFKGTTRIHKDSRFFKRYVDNSYSAPTTADPIYWIENNTLNFLPAVTVTNGCELTYIKLPTALDASTDPIVLSSADKVMVAYATYELLQKERTEEVIPQAQLMLKEFLQEVETL